MIPAEFEYVRATSVDHAIELLQDGRGETKLLAGGHSLIPLMKLRLARPGRLVDIRSIGGLDTIQRLNGVLSIGPLATYHAVATSDLVQQVAPLLAEAAGYVGDVQVRNAGTLGGGLAHADPGADAAAHVVDGVEVNGDLHASSEYRAAMTRVFARRALETARDRARVA